MSEASGNGRNANGQFAEGNPGGPGRPRRSVERDYLATLSDTVTTDAWAQICARAVEDAKGGDAKAREWLTRHCIGKEPQSLMELAAKESRVSPLKTKLTRRSSGKLAATTLSRDTKTSWLSSSRLRRWSKSNLSHRRAYWVPRRQLAPGPSTPRPV